MTTGSDLLIPVAIAAVPTVAGLAAGAAVASVITGWALRWLVATPGPEEIQTEGTL